MLSAQQILKGFLCPCFESTEEKALREAIVCLGKGSGVVIQRNFKKSNATSSFLGMITGGKGNSRDIRLYLDGTDLICEAQNKEDISPNSDDDKIWLNKIGEVKTKESSRVVHLIGNHQLRPGEILLDIEFSSFNKDQFNEFSDALRICVEAYRRNPYDAQQPGRAKNNEKDDNDPTGLKARAKRAAHFTKREIELKQHKQEREKRKEKYLKGSGGLKYTAIAMANRS